MLRIISVSASMSALHLMYQLNSSWMLEHSNTKIDADWNLSMPETGFEYLCKTFLIIITDVQNYKVIISKEVLFHHQKCHFFFLEDCTPLSQIVLDFKFPVLKFIKIFDWPPHHQYQDDQYSPKILTFWWSNFTP